MLKKNFIATAVGTGLLVLFINVGISLAHDLVFPAATLKTIYPQTESFEQKNLYVSDEQKAAIEKTLGSRLPEEDLKPSIYFTIVRPGPDARPRKEAVIMFIDAPGEVGKIEMGVAVSGKGDLIKIHLFENKESKSLSHPDFLRQFDGKKPSSGWLYCRQGYNSAPGHGQICTGYCIRGQEGTAHHQ